MRFGKDQSHRFAGEPLSDHIAHANRPDVTRFNAALTRKTRQRIFKPTARANPIFINAPAVCVQSISQFTNAVTNTVPPITIH